MVKEHGRPLSSVSGTVPFVVGQPPVVFLVASSSVTDQSAALPDWSSGLLVPIGVLLPQALSWTRVS